MTTTCFVHGCREIEAQHVMQQLTRTSHSSTRPGEKSGPGWLLVSLILALFFGAPYTCAAQADRLSAEISNAELEQRLKFIETRLAGQTPDARYWQYGWTGFHAVSAAAQGVLALDANDSDDEVNYLVGAVKSTGALAQMLIMPLPAVQSAARFQGLPAQSREERFQKLMQGEALLHENAGRAVTRSSWKRHLIGIGVNLFGGVAIAAFGDSSDAVTSTLLGIAVSEASIWTEPSRAVNDLNDYQNNKWMARKTSEVSWHVVPLARRVEVNIRF